MPSSAPDGSRPSPGERPAQRSAWPLFAILAVCAAPVVAAWLAYFVWPPATRLNHGELLQPRVLSDAPFERISGGASRLSELRGKWVLVHIDRAECDNRCREKLLYMRQARLTQGREMERIERVWLVLDDGRPDPGLLQEFSGTVVLRARDAPMLAEFPAARDLRDHIFLIDPLGNLMLRYPRDPDPNGMKRDLSRLLRVSRIG